MPTLRPLVAASCLLGAAAILMPAPERADAAGKGAKVVRVLDGDTVRVRVGSRLRVVHLEGVRAHSLRTCRGKLAAARLRKILRPRRKLVLRTRSRSFTRAKAFRAEVYLPRRRGARTLSRAMLSSGHARVRTNSRLRSRYHRSYAAAQRSAKKRARGIWGSRCPSRRGSAPTPSPGSGPGMPTDSSPAGPGTPLPNGVGLQLAATGFDRPIHVTGRPGATGLIVAEQPGTVRIARNGAPLATPLLDLSTAVHQGGGERGLLGLAFHPNHRVNGLFYVHYVDAVGWSRVVEYHVAPGSDVANAASARELLALRQPSDFHNGGHLAFGTDGMLYIGLGDGGPPANSQDITNLLGTILRIDVNGTQAALPYRIPADNPFVGVAGARGEIWAYGLRNPWRFSVDRETGALWIGDVGQDRLEEIDYTPAGSGGANFGWNAFEAGLTYGGTLVGGPHIGPVASYSHDDGSCSVTGGHVYRGKLVPGLSGRYVYTDFCSGRFWTLSAASPGAAPVEITDELGPAVTFTTSFGEDNSGELYLTSSGSVYRFIAK